jgi:hypothetical protein
MSTSVIAYEGSITVAGKVPDFENMIDPQHWHTNFPFIWPASYLIQEPLSPDRDPTSTNPPGLPMQPTASRDARLFEQVLFMGGAIVYSNVINTKLRISAGRLRLDYSQVDCRTTDTLFNTVDGGIDIDTGLALVVPADTPDHVTVTVTKTVRFTEPTPLVDIADPLFDAVVQMTMTALLHSLIFVGVLA